MLENIFWLASGIIIAVATLKIIKISFCEPNAPMRGTAPSVYIDEKFNVHEFNDRETMEFMSDLLRCGFVERRVCYKVIAKGMEERKKMEEEWAAWEDYVVGRLKAEAKK